MNTLPDWIRRLLIQIGMRPDVVQGDLDHPVYLSDLHSVPCASPGRELVRLLEALHERNLLNLDKGEDTFQEGQQIYIWGVPLKLKYVQDKRLVFELPPGKRFRRPYDGRPVAKEKKE